MFCELVSLKIANVWGGVDYEEQFWNLMNNPDILISTPGRLIELIDMKRGSLLNL